MDMKKGFRPLVFIIHMHSRERTLTKGWYVNWALLGLGFLRSHGNVIGSDTHVARAPHTQPLGEGTAC